jgi:upstream activation factor subunit UAF30
MAARTKSPTSRRGAAAKKPATRVTSSRAQTTRSKTSKPTAAKAAGKPRAAAASASRGAAKAAPARKAASSSRGTASRGTASRGTATASRGTSARGASTRSAGGAKSASRRPRGGLAQQVQPDATLAAIVGNEPTTRADLTKRIWAYIRKNDLQDSENRRQINADEKLKKVFGGKDQVSMFEMTRLVNQHVS